ncbi:AraC family transcriptional regulator [soil metagenome]
MLNIYDFICSTSSQAQQAKFGKGEEVFIDYRCPITDEQAQVWSHKNLLMFVMEGIKGYETFNGYHVSEKHQILFVRKGGFVLHQHFEKPYHALVFMFDDDFVKAFMQDYPSLLKSFTHAENDFIDLPNVMQLKSSPFIESIFFTSRDYLMEGDTYSLISLELKLKELFVNLLKEKKDNPFNFYLSYLVSDELISFIKLVRENYQRNFTMEELAKTTAMSVSTFKRVFKAHFGKPPGKWLHEQRISKATELLSNPQISISEIAFQLGYSGVAAFSKAFKNSTSIRPSDFLKAHATEPY